MSNSSGRNMFQNFFGQIPTEDRASGLIREVAIYFYGLSTFHFLFAFLFSPVVVDVIIMLFLALWLHFNRSKVAAVGLLVYIILQMILKIVIYITIVQKANPAFIEVILVFGVLASLTTLVYSIIGVKAAWRLQEPKREVSVS